MGRNESRENRSKAGQQQGEIAVGRDSSREEWQWWEQ